MAGLEVVRLISEPTAAAFHFGMTNKREERINVLVFDLGGGTLDVSILSIFENKYEVKSTKGDTHLGGKDFDDILAIHFHVKHLFSHCHLNAGQSVQLHYQYKHD